MYVRVGVRVDAYACGCVCVSAAGVTIVFAFARERHMRPVVVRTHVRVHVCVRAYTRADAATRRPHYHAIPGLRGERIEFVEITFSREPRSRNANCYPTGIREPAMVNSNF